MKNNWISVYPTMLNVKIKKENKKPNSHTVIVVMEFILASGFTVEP